MTSVKKRYKKLREILDQAEMRERAEIVVENEKLKIVSWLDIASAFSSADSPIKLPYLKACAEL